MNGYACKDPKVVIADDFYASGLDIVGNTSNPRNYSEKFISVNELPGINTFGITVARGDMGPGGFNPPHSHPRASEIIIVIEGTIEATFMTSEPVRLIKKVLEKGDVFVNPPGLIHYQRNVGDGHVVLLAALAGQNPGKVEYVSDAFQVDEDVIGQLLANF